MKKQNGFTLIELLVVVLIIGILAGVAIPSYQRAAEKSKASQGLIILKAVDKSFQNFYLANRTWPKSFDELEVSLPADFNIDENFVPNHVTYGKSSKDWNISFEWYTWDNSVLTLYMIRRTGKYQGAGFTVQYVSSLTGTIPPKTILCYERKSAGRQLFNSNLKPGAYCEGVMSYKKLLSENVYDRWYGM